MVSNITTLGRNGVHDFILVRSSAIVISLYAIFMAAFFAFTPDITFETWTGLFERTWVKVFTLLALIAVATHVWIGLWQVLTDYVKPTLIRGLLQFAVNMVAIGYVIAGLVILWGV